MKRGTRIGHAYMAITADGTGVNKEIVDAVDDATGDIEKSGDEAGERYGSRFSARFRERMAPMVEKIGARLSTQMAQDDPIGRGLETGFDDGDGASLGRRMADSIGEALTDRLESQVADMLDGIEARVNAASVSGNGSGRQSSRLFPPRDPDDRVWVSAHEADKKYNESRLRLLDLAYKEHEKFARARGLMVEQALRMDADFEKKREALIQAQGRMVDQALKLNEAHDKKQEALIQAQGKMVDQAIKMDEAHNKKQEALIQSQGRMVDQAIKMNEAHDKKRGLELDRAYRDNEEFDRTRGRMLDTAHKMNLEFDRKRTKMLVEAHRMNMEFAKGQRGGDGRTIPKGKKEWGDLDFDVKIGKMLGAGSRNNFLNLMGKSMGGIIKMATKMGKAVGTAFTTFQQGMAKAGEGASMLARMSSGAGAVGSKAMTSLAASGPAAAAAIIVVVVAMSAMVSVASALLALVTALAATIASGLTGAVMVLGGVLTAAAAAGGMLAVAFTSLTEAQSKAMAADFTPIKDQLAGLGQYMLAEMIPAFETWAGNIQDAVYLLAPMASVMGQAFASVGNALTAALSGPGFQNLAYALGTYLPSIVARLGAALGSALNGTAGMFAALMPLVNRFAGYLAQVAERFSKWANSAEGQNSIENFANRAVNALISLWGFVREFSGFVFDVLFSPEAQNAGNTMFDSLRDSFASFREAIEDGRLEKWFNDALHFGGQLKDMMTALGDTFVALSDDGVLDMVGSGFEKMAATISALSTFVDGFTSVLGGGSGLIATMGVLLAPLQATVASLITMGEAVEWVGGLVGMGNGAEWEDAGSAWLAMAKGWNSGSGGTGGSGMFGGLFDQIRGGIESVNETASNAIRNQSRGWDLPSMDWFTSKGGGTRDETLESNGGNKPDKVEWVNPYKAWAEGLIKDGPSVAAQIRQAMKALEKQVDKAIKQAVTAANAGEAREALGGLAKTMRDTAKQTVDSAQEALNTAARSLASATDPSDAARALAQVRKSQTALSSAIANQTSINAAARKLSAQKVVTQVNVTRLVNGMRAQNATLADYAAARERVTAKLERANQRLTDAIAMRNDYRTQVADATRAFGSILTAQASTIDGVQQALSHGDITSNLQTRLDQIKKFQAELNILLANGLSNDAYKQLVDGGVDGSGAYVSALVQGGQGAVTQVNDLTKQIDSISKSLGTQASNRLYQSGVDAAQGLVDGLESMSARLDSAAERLGYSIAKAVKRSLGIKSPSRVMYEAMGYVGDGIESGLDAQHTKVSGAAGRLSAQVAITPSLAEAYAAGRVPAAVSGNPASQPKVEHNWNITTPTENPKAVAREMINEMTGRL